MTAPLAVNGLTECVPGDLAEFEARYMEALRRTGGVHIDSRVAFDPTGEPRRINTFAGYAEPPFAFSPGGEYLFPPLHKGGHDHDS